MIRRRFLQELLAPLGLSASAVIAGCAGGESGQERTLVTTAILRIRIRLNNGVEKIIRVPRGSTVLAAIRCRPFYYHQSDDGMTIIKDIRGHWRYTVNDSEPRYETGQRYRISAGDYRLISNCRLDLYLL